MSVRERREDSRRPPERAGLQRWVETAGAHLLVVDPHADDAGLTAAMAARGVHVTWVASMLDGLVAFGRTAPHAVLVSPLAPGMPAAEFVAAVRRDGTPCAVALVEDADLDHVGPAVLAGASALVGRPYRAEQVWDVLTHGPRPVTDTARLTVGPIELDPAAFTVRVDGVRIGDLPLKEFELLRALMQRSPGLVTDDELVDALWGEAARRPGPNTIAMHVTRLRARLEGTADVRRVRGRGYTLSFG